MSKDWLQTYTGKKFYPLNPNPDDICIEDIAHSLANQCRYNGHCKEFYSVAQHSALMAAWWFHDNLELARYALLHDASEAYLSDLPRPLKYLPEFQFYRDAEKHLSEMIYIRFGLNPVEPKEIKAADREILGDELLSPKIISPPHPDWLLPNGRGFTIYPTSPEQAEQYFLDQYENLFYD